MLYRDRIVIPVSLREEILDGIPDGYSAERGPKGQFGRQGFRMTLKARLLHVVFVKKIDTYSKGNH